MLRQILAEFSSVSVDLMQMLLSWILEVEKFETTADAIAYHQPKQIVGWCRIWNFIYW